MKAREKERKQEGGREGVGKRGREREGGSRYVQSRVTPYEGKE